MFNFTIVVFDGTSPTFYFTNTSGWNTSRSKVLNELKKKRRYWNLKAETLDSTLWWIRLKKGYGPVARQTTQWIKMLCFVCFCCCCPFCNRKYPTCWYLNKWITLKNLIYTQVSYFSVILHGLNVFAQSPQSTPFFKKSYDLVYRMISIVLLGYIFQTYWSLFRLRMYTK